MTVSPLPYRRWSVPIENLETGMVCPIVVQSQTKADAAIDGLLAAFQHLHWRRSGPAGEPEEIATGALVIG